MRKEYTQEEIDKVVVGSVWRIKSLTDETKYTDWKVIKGPHIAPLHKEPVISVEIVETTDYTQINNVGEVVTGYLVENLLYVSTYLYGAPDKPITTTFVPKYKF